MTKKKPEYYEYAGFEYEVERDGVEIRMVPLPDQHPAAGKEKHRRNAIAQYRQDMRLTKEGK